jgi:hypothetical protein
LENIGEGLLHACISSKLCINLAPMVSHDNILNIITQLNSNIITQLKLLET